jgi:hypothetical protein
MPSAASSAARARSLQPPLAAASSAAAPLRSASTPIVDAASTGSPNAVSVCPKPVPNTLPSRLSDRPLAYANPAAANTTAMNE